METWSQLDCEFSLLYNFPAFIIFCTLSCFFTPHRCLCLLNILCLASVSNILILDTYIQALTHLWGHGVHEDKGKQWCQPRHKWSRAFLGAAHGSEWDGFERLDSKGPDILFFLLFA